MWVSLILLLRIKLSLFGPFIFLKPKFHRLWNKDVEGSKWQIEPSDKQAHCESWGETLNVPSPLKNEQWNKSTTTLHPLRETTLNSLETIQEKEKSNLEEHPHWVTPRAMLATQLHTV